MSTVELKSGSVPFKPRARLLKLIGAELISDDVVAVTELVKNSYDADAATVVIRFSEVSGEGGTITILDDGIGMDREGLLGGWMEPAGSTKRGAGRKVTPKGRWLLGEKGLGRFAADKLGRELELVSRRQGNAAEIRAIFDWDRFDDEDALLGEVRNHWEIRPATEIQDFGTVLRIRRLRSAWNERMFRRLCTRLSRLTSPFGSKHAFSIRIESDEFPQYAGELRTGFLQQAPHTLDARFDGEAALRMEVGGRSVTLPWTGPLLTCGPLRVRLHAFDLETEAMARIGPRQEVRAWLKEWCGISVYRDGFRVWPYGEPHDDWLRLDQRRVNNPVVCLSNNQVVGFVEITQEHNPELRDQTNREGIISNPALDDLRRLMHFILQQLEAHRQTVRHPAGQRFRRGRPGRKAAGGAGDADTLRSVAERVAALPKGGRLASELRGITTRLAEESSKRESEMHRLAQGYAELAARGQATSGLSREIGPVLMELQRSLSSGRGRTKGASEAASTFNRSVDWLVARLALIAGTEDGGGRRRRVIEVPVELGAMAELMRYQLQAQQVRFRLDTSGGQLLRAALPPTAFRTVLHILISNSLEWLTSAKQPLISICARAEGPWCRVTVTDNGAGIPAGMEEEVFQAHRTLKEGGRGMGLTLARQLLALHGGTLTAEHRRKGAQLCLLLPRKRSRATPGRMR